MLTIDFAYLSLSNSSHSLSTIQPKSVLMAIRFMQCMIVLAFLSALIVSATSAEPFIVAHKKASLKRLKSGVERVLVSIDVYNQGSTAAYDLTLTDSSWLKDAFTVTSGDTSASWDKLDAGSAVSHTFELEAKEKKLFNGEPALITFRIPTKADLLMAYSSPIPPLEILAEKTPVKKLDLIKRLLAKYGSLVSVISGMILFVYLLAIPSKSSGPRGSKKRH